MKNTSTLTTTLWLMFLVLLWGAAPVYGQSSPPSLRIVLPERTRLLENQQVDLVLEIRNAPTASGLKVTTGGTDITSHFGAAKAADLDCDGSQD